MRLERYRWVLACNLFVILTVSFGTRLLQPVGLHDALAAQRGFSVASDLDRGGPVFSDRRRRRACWLGGCCRRSDVRLVMIVGALFSAPCDRLHRASARRVAVVSWCMRLFGIGYTGISVLPATTLITRWFESGKRPLALSFTSTGLSLGGVIRDAAVGGVARALADRAAPRRCSARYSCWSSRRSSGSVVRVVLRRTRSRTPLRSIVRERRLRSRYDRGSSSC